MAMKICKECGNEVSKSARTCPKCGKEQRNFFIRHKFITFLLILCLIGFISAMTGNNNTQNKKDSSNTMETEGEINNYYVKIGEATITNDGLGKNILLLNISFTNNNDEAKAFMYNLDCKMYQNGVELKMPISTYGIENYNWEDKTKEIQSGVNFEFKLAFEIEDLSSPVNVEITPYVSSKNSPKIVKTINLK